jgi:hypothetical protein
MHAGAQAVQSARVARSFLKRESVKATTFSRSSIETRNELKLGASIRVFLNHTLTEGTNSKPPLCRYANGNIAELYTLSVRNVHFGFRRGSKPDIKSLKPIFGRYIVNVMESPTAGSTLSDRTFDAVTVTKITHNSGASWVRV